MNHHRLLALASVLLLLAATPSAGWAQRRDTASTRASERTDPRLEARGLTQSDVIERLRASGMTREQVRAELRRRGYDPSLADPYFDVLEREGAGRARGRDDFGSLLEEIGRTGGRGDTLAPRDPRALRDLRSRFDPDTLDPFVADSLAAEDRWLDVADRELEDMLGLTARDRLAPGELAVFGRSFFSRAGGQVDVPTYGPVDASYRLGAGDEVNVVLTGAVQDAYALRVDREGMLVVPEAGQVAANGLTLAALEDLLRARFANVYSGDLTRVNVSLGRVRMIQVYVIGDVERPGAYQVSSLGTVLGALYRAGGPSNTGSFREIEIRRGNQMLARFDLYDYLLHGNSQLDTRLENGDVVFVPPVARRVKIDGAVKRPGIYELRAGDGVRTALRYAGGPEAEAALRRVQIDRIVPPSQRAPGVERVLVDVDVVKLLDPAQPDVPLTDGDALRVFSVSDERRNLVTIVGEVRRPGSYAWSAGTTLADVLERASGPTEAAYTGRAHVYRLDPSTGARRLHSASLDANARVALEDRDSVVVYSRERLRTREYVTIGGYVKRPGRYALPEGATVNDLILAAGGFTEGAYQSEAYVARPNLAAARSDSTAQALRVPLRADAGTGDNGAQPVSSNAPQWALGEGEFVLRHGDRIEIRPAPGYERPRTVIVTGEVALPGTYVLETRQDRLSGLVAAAGGLTNEAYAPGTQLVRGGDVMGTTLPAALARPQSDADLVLQPGDSIHVPRYDGTVLVTGAVAERARVPYRPGMSLDEYVRAAGGYTRAADRAKVVLTHQNGQRQTVTARHILPDGKPNPTPGSTIFVPERPAGVREGFNWGALITQVIAGASAVATLLIALNNN